MSDETSALKKVTPRNLAAALAVVAAIQVLALAITSQNAPLYQAVVNESGYSYNPLGASPIGSAGNALVLVGAAFVLTILLVRLLRRKMVFSFRALIFGSLAMSSFILTFITADDFAYQYVPSLEIPIALGAPILIVVAVGYIVFVKNNLWLSTGVLAFVGAEVGSFFAQTLPPLTALVLPAAFSVYDIYAVFKGPLKQLIGTAPGIALTGMSIKAGEFTLGLGDIVFYTMLPCLAYFRTGAISSLATIVAIDAGVLITLFLLSRRRLLPGLPIPMLFGLGVLAVYLL